MRYTYIRADNLIDLATDITALCSSVAHGPSEIPGVSGRFRTYWLPDGPVTYLHEIGFVQRAAFHVEQE